MAGRRGLYENWITPDGLTAIEGWAREGATDSDISKKIGVVLSTFCEWKNRFPQISEALKKGKAPVDFEVENALLKRALGFEYVEKKKVRMPDGSERIENTVKYVVPDTTAQIFWLKNRRPDKWRDKHEVTTAAQGQLADLIDGLKEPVTDDLYTETAGFDGAVADEPPAAN